MMTLLAQLSATNARLRQLGLDRTNAFVHLADAGLIIDEDFVKRANQVSEIIVAALAERIRAGRVPLISLEQAQTIIEPHMGHALPEGVLYSLALQNRLLTTVGQSDIGISIKGLVRPVFDRPLKTAAEFDEALETAFDRYKALTKVCPAPPHRFHPEVAEFYATSELPHRAAVLVAGAKLMPGISPDLDLEVRKVFEISELLPEIAATLKAFITAQIEAGEIPAFLAADLPSCPALEAAIKLLGAPTRAAACSYILHALHLAKSHLDGFVIDCPSLEHADILPVEITTYFSARSNAHYDVSEDTKALHRKLLALVEQEEARAKEQEGTLAAEDLLAAQPLTVRVLILGAEQGLIELAQNNRIPRMRIPSKLSARDPALSGQSRNPGPRHRATIGSVFQQYMSLKHGVTARMEDRRNTPDHLLTEPVESDPDETHITAWIPLAQ